MFVKIKEAANNETININHVAVYYIGGYAKNVLFFKNYRYKNISQIAFRGKQEALDALEKLEKAIINKAPYIEL